MTYSLCDLLSTVCGAPKLRIAAVEKTARDERDWLWFRDF